MSILKFALRIPNLPQSIMQKLLHFIWKVFKKITPRIMIGYCRLKLYAQGINFGKNLIVESGVQISGGGKVFLGNNVWLGRGVFINVWPGSELIIGDDTYIGRGTIILAHESVQIGSYTMVAPYCHITDVNHGTELGRPMRKQPLSSKPLKISSDVWIGAGCSILPGVTIQDGAIIGARAVVTKDIAQCAIAVGAPAKVIGFRK